jgi:hypothetical protein
MKSAALQELVKYIFSDEKTKQAFLSDPESIISKYKLSRQEKEAVLANHSKLGLVTSNSPQLEAVINPAIEWFAPSP